MIYLILYTLLLFIELGIAFGLCIFALSMVFSSIMGAPYVPTSKKELKRFLDEVGLKKGKVFIELGCGDARVARFAAKEYGTKSIGIDINWILIKWAQLLSKLEKNKNITLLTQSVFKTDVSKADFIYLFLMPEMLVKLLPKLQKETKKGTIFISHGFKLEPWKKYLYKTIESKPFPTYFYSLTPRKRVR